MRKISLSVVALASLVVLVACANMAPPEPPSLDLPKPPLDLRATRKGDKVMLTWTVPTLTTDRQRVRSLGSTRICRALNVTLTECGTRVGEAAPPPVTSKPPAQKMTGSYTDSLAQAIENDASFMTYAVEVLNPDGHGAGLSNQVRVSLARTLPPPRDFHAQLTAQGVVLSWSGKALPTSSPNVHYVYRVYRRLEGGQQQVLAGELPVEGQDNLTLTDSAIEWEKTYEYHAETVTVITQQNKSEVQIAGDDTPETKVFADDIFPPAVPSGLQAVFSGPGQQPFIDLIWAPVTDSDLDGYNVYRREENGTLAKLNTSLIKVPGYRDPSVAPGKHYFYSVSAVDVRGNESARSEDAAEAVPQGNSD